MAKKKRIIFSKYKNTALNKRDENIITMYFDLFERGLRVDIIYKYIEKKYKNYYNLNVDEIKNIIEYHRQSVRKLRVKTKHVA